jgi:hypothetical protein
MASLGPPKESDDPWAGRQPRYDKLVMPGPGRFELVTKLPDGTPVSVRLVPAARPPSRGQ